MATAKKRERVSREEEVFVNELLKGTPQRHAFLMAFPEKVDWKWSSVDSAASTLFHSRKVQKRYNVLLAKIRAKELADVKWTREQAILTLTGVIDKNTRELKRIDDSFEEEIALILSEIERAPQKAPELVRELLRKKRARRVSSIFNAGIVAAVSELNKMQGFNEENINVNGTVIFSGEDEIPE